MPRVTPLKASVNSGELSGLMAARSDFALYPNAAKILENFLLLPQGGATRRPGTRYIAQAKASSGPYRLIPFERSADQAYVIEAGQGYFRFYTRQGVIEQSGSPGTPYELTTPYTSFDPFKLQWAQQDDIMILVHPDFPPQQLSRIAEDNWSIAEIEFEKGPFLAENETATTLVVSATTGTFTLTASASLFQASHVGSIWGLALSTGVASSATWEPGEVIALNEGRQFEGRLYTAKSAGTTGSIAPVHEEGTVSDGAVDWKYLQTGLYAPVEITAFTDDQNVSAVAVHGELRGQLTTATTYWREGSWSGVRGYPKAVTLLDNRAWYGGTATQPQTVWGSAVGNFQDFHPQGTTAGDVITDDGSIEATLQSSQVSPVLWLMVQDDIIIGTSNGPWRLSASSGGVITPTNVQARRQSTIGCSSIPAIELNSSLMFVPRDLRHLYDLQIYSEFDKFEAVDQTLLSSHILTSGVVEMTYQAQPLSTLWALRADGVLATFAFNRTEEIRGWSRQVLAGADMVVKSVTAIPGDSQTNSEDRDEVWVAVERTINGATGTYIEMVEAPHEEADAVHDAWHLDSALKYTGASTTTITGLGHLEGETVAVWGDSGVIEANKVVSSGEITLVNAVTSAIVGLLPTCTYQMLPVDAGSPTGTALSKKQRLSELRFLLYLTSGLKVSSENDEFQDLYDLDRMIIRSSPYERLTGQYGVRTRDSRWKHDPAPVMKNETGGHTTVLGVVPFIEVTE